MRRLTVFGSEITDIKIKVYGLAHFAVQGAATQEGIVFHLLETTWSPEALFIAGRVIPGRWLALGFRFGAF